jgi:phage terminase large subunit GpA-like protein
MAQALPSKTSAFALLHRMYKHAMSAHRRTMAQFAEGEIIIPDGPMEGMRYRLDRLPYTRLYFDAVDSGKWSRFAAVGPTQTGKTLTCFIIPALYHLFEIGETVVCALPDMDMANDKWRIDFLPVIQRTRYAALMPRSGAGSRGGNIDSIEFQNGAMLKFMSAGGNDKERAGFTTRIVVASEVDGFDTAGKASREADKMSQIEARTMAYGDQKRVYMECTASIPSGRIWQERESGTNSEIEMPCPLCGEWVTPGRAHLIGWQEAENEIEAEHLARFSCPACQSAWDETQRAHANRASRLIHGNDPDSVKTLGFRWSAVNNLLVPAGVFGLKEWKAARATDEDNAEKEIHQFVWGLPYQGHKIEMAELKTDALLHRFSETGRGVVPALARVLTVGVDLGKYLGHYAVYAWADEARGWLIDYGRFEIASQELGEERATMVALRGLRDSIGGGFVQEEQGKNKSIDAVWIDAGWAPTAEAVYQFCDESGGDVWRPCKSHGAGQGMERAYNVPKSTGATVRLLGNNYHFSLLKPSGVLLVEVNADHWKSFYHQRISVPADHAGAVTFFLSPDRNEHMALVKHLTAEKAVEEYDPKKGLMTVWRRIRKQNHWLDCSMLASAAGHYAGVRILSPTAPQRHGTQRPTRRPSLTMPDGRPFDITRR